MKRLFNKLYYARYDVRMLETKIQEKKQALYSVKGITYDKELSRINTNKDLARYFEEIEELEEKLQKAQDKVTKLEVFFRKKIDKITSDKVERTLLKLYYINNFKIYQIAYVLDYSERQTMRIKKKADEKIKEYIDDVI